MDESKHQHKKPKTEGGAPPKASQCNGANAPSTPPGPNRAEKVILAAAKRLPDMNMAEDYRSHSDNERLTPEKEILPSTFPTKSRKT